MNGDVSKYLLKEADILEGLAIDAVKEGKISVDEYHQMALVAMLYIREDIFPDYSHRQELAFAFGMARVCAGEIKQGVERGDYEYAIAALRLANISVGVTSRIELDIERQKAKATKAAQARHSGTELYKKIVWNYYKEGMGTFKSYDQAAEKISSRDDVPFAFRTVRKWITEFHKIQKKLPSA